MELTIKDSCILCSKKFDWNEIATWKLPENIWFCQNCITKFQDDKKYTWNETWIVQEFEPWIIFENTNIN